MNTSGTDRRALTHVGQLARLRRLTNSSLKGETYVRAKIEKRSVGIDQQAPEYEFD